MAHLQRAVASLRIAGEDLVPAEISALLGATPTHAQARGQELPLGSGGTRVALFGQWRLEATDTEPEDLNRQVAELLGKLTSDLAVWRDLAKRFNIDLFCGWFMGGDNEGVTVEPQTLQSLGERGIALALDIYGPDGDA
jgi:hypothetical protein